MQIRAIRSNLKHTTDHDHPPPPSAKPTPLFRRCDQAHHHIPNHHHHQQGEMIQSTTSTTGFWSGGFRNCFYVSFLIAIAFGLGGEPPLMDEANLMMNEEAFLPLEGSQVWPRSPHQVITAMIVPKSLLGL